MKRKEKKIMHLIKGINLKNLYIITLRCIFIYLNIVYKYNILNKYKWLKYNNYKWLNQQLFKYKRGKTRKKKEEGKNKKKWIYLIKTKKNFVSCTKRRRKKALLL